MKEPATRLIRPEVRALRAYGVEDPGRLVKLDANENPFPAAPALRERLLEAARRLELNRYPDPAAAVLRRQLSRRIGWPEEGLLLGNGSDELIVLLLLACGGEGATLLVPVPTFSMYRHLGLAAGWRVVEQSLDARYELPRAEFLERASRLRPRLTVLAYPNNPTGNCFDRATMEELLRASEGLVVVDEAYHDFCGRTFAPLLREHPRLVVLRTLSKIGLAALRVGVLAADPELVSEFEKVRLPFNVSSFSQAAAAAALEEEEALDAQIRGIVAERALLAEEMGRISGVTAFPSEANFVLFRTRWPSRTIFEALRAEGVLIRDLGGQPGPLEGCLRVTVGTPQENKKFCVALRKACSA